MTQKKLLTLMAAGLLAGLSACEKEQFDKQRYNEYVDYEFMIDNMDMSHQWQLTHSDTLTVKTSDAVHKVQILTDNPINTTNVEVAAEAVCYGNEAVLAYTIPNTQSTVYLSAIATNGNFLGIRKLTFGTKELDLTDIQQTEGSNINITTPQTFTYLYEENFPEPGDFDYNDLVLRVGKGYTESSYDLLLTVTVAAAGAVKQIAAGINLGGVSYDEVSKVEIVGGDIMDKDYPLPRRIMGSSDLLLRGRNGEAVINLFEDAHWVLLSGSDTNGSITRMLLNTVRGETEFRSASVSPVSRAYRITFRHRETARLLSFDQIDPFILEEYNGSVWEVHTYPYKFNDVLKDIFRGNQSAYDNHVSWCIVVPQKDFRYPIEGMSLGTYNKENGEVFGPYPDFANWMKNHFSYNNWYTNATHPQLLY